MEQNVDQFYVALMSNNSMEHYPDNVLSAFTNKLPRPVQLIGTWVVGLTHISYGPFSSFQRMVMLPENESDVEIFEPISVNRPVPDPSPIPPKKRRRVRRDREYRTQKQEASVEKKVEIKVSDVYNIVLTQSDLQELTYEKHHLNAGKLLKILGDKIEPKLNVDDPKVYYEMEMLRRKIKHQIMDLIEKEDWITDNKIMKQTRKKDEFMLHVYQGSSKSTNIPIRYLKHNNIEAFIKEIVYQLPLINREKNSLAQLFNLFHNSYDLMQDNMFQSPKKTDATNLYIPLTEYGSSTGLNTKRILETRPNVMEAGISMDEIIALFRENLQYKDEKKLSSAEKLELRLKIKNAIVDVLRGNALNAPFIPKQFKKDDLPLNVPYEKIGTNSFNYYRTVLEAKAYDHEDHFLNEIYNQIPLEKRDKKVFLETLNQAFVKSINSKRSTNEIEDLSTYKRPVDYSDTTKPNAPPIEFPVRPVAIQEQLKESQIAPTPAPAPTLAPSPASAPTVVTTPTPNPDPTHTSEPEQPASVEDDKTTHYLETKTRLTLNFTPKTNTESKLTEIVASRRDIHKNRFIFVYSDVICGRIIGESITKFLRIIPLTDNSRDLQFKHVEYINVERNYIDSIEILLTNSFGERIEFQASTIPTFLMLHFKRL